MLFTGLLGPLSCTFRILRRKLATDDESRAGEPSNYATLAGADSINHTRAALGQNTVAFTSSYLALERQFMRVERAAGLRRLERRARHRRLLPAGKPKMPWSQTDDTGKQLAKVLLLAQLAQSKGEKYDAVADFLPELLEPIPFFHQPQSPASSPGISARTRPTIMRKPA
jgi:hypothetical protein